MEKTKTSRQETMKSNYYYEKGYTEGYIKGRQESIELLGTVYDKLVKNKFEISIEEFYKIIEGEN